MNGVLFLATLTLVSFVLTCIAPLQVKDGGSEVKAG